MQFFLLCLMLVGILLAKLRMVDDRARSSLSDLILNVFLPCNILSSFFDTDSSKLPSLVIIFVISLSILLCSFLLAQFFFRKTGTEQKKVLVYATIISNASFLGNPVVESIFGLEALIYSAAYLVPIRLALWSVGIAIFTGGWGNWKKVVFHPCLVGTYLGILVMVTGFRPPSVISRLAFSLGNCTTPISMMLVGSVLAMVEPKKLVTKLTACYTFIRLLLIPLSLFGVLLIFRPPTIVSGVAVILCGTPAAVTTSILATKYGGDRELASKIIFCSTLLSVVTLPFLIWLLGFL